ncbi:MAG: MraY family glycosyltransferase, partial [Candidatus Shapirobacteria bacterium]|nr:MraY family glycosyltransferase [Candidatus Shapirobacteria bacterium]
FILSIFISATISFLVTPLVRNYLTKHGLVENPLQKQQKTHNATALFSVPRGGGIPIFISVLASSLVFLSFDKHLAGIILAAFVTLFVGIIDDLKDIRPSIRLFTNLLAALIVVASGIGIAYISNPFGGIIDLSFLKINFNFFGNHSIWIISDILAIIWIIWCMNIVGWSSGIDGQLPGFVAISAIFIGILGFRFSADTTQWPVIFFSAAVAGAYLGFLPFNFFPQTIMTGYSGKSLAGFFLAVLSLLSGAKLATLVLLLGIPIIDAIFVLFKRITSGRFPLTGGPDHLHHQLLKIGWSRPKIALFYWGLSLFLGMISLFLNSQQKFYFFLGIVILFISFVLKVSRRI